MGETKGFLFFIGNFFGKKKIGYQFTNRKTGKVTKFGLNTNSASKIMQKKTGSWYKVPPPPPGANRVNIHIKINNALIDRNHTLLRETFTPHWH